MPSRTGRIGRTLALAVAWILTSTALWAGTIDGGTDHTVAIKSDGSVWSWGKNLKGQLGDGTLTQRKSPVAVVAPAGLNNVILVGAGAQFTAVLTQTGSVWTWGDNSVGQLGDGASSATRSTPYEVAGLDNVVAIAVGYQFVLAVKNDGTVFSWGANVNGQLGTGDVTGRSSPTQVRDATGTGYLAGVTAVAAGATHSLALIGNGVVAFGNNTNGQLGNNASSTTPVTLPISVKGQGGVGLLSGIVAIAGGGAHSLALSNDTLLWAWGKGGGGQIGDGGTSTRKAPVRVKDASGNVSGAAEIAAGDVHSLAAKTDGSAWAWGTNASGQAGQGDVAVKKLAVRVKDQPGTGFLPSVNAIAAGFKHSLAVVSGGNAWAWGLNSSGQLGNGATASVVNLPVPVGGTGFVWMAATPVFTPIEGIYPANQSVTISCRTAGAAIHYTTGTVGVPPLDPTLSDPVLGTGATLPIAISTVVKAKAWANLLAPSATAQGTFVLKASPPLLSPGGGTFSTAPSVSMSTTTQPPVAIHYTLNGTDPSSGSSQYASPVSIATSSQLVARAFKTDWDPSDPTSATYTLNYGTLPLPTFDPPAGPYGGSLNVAISAQSGAAITYTTNGSDPDQFSTAYSSPISISTTTTLKAKAFHVDWTPSAVASALYTIAATAQAPVISPAGGTFASKITVTLSSGTPGASVYFTLDGTAPTTASTPYVPPLVLSDSARLRAIATAPGYPPSAITTADFFLTGAVSAGTAHTVALKTNGELWAWGRNQSGQLGIGTISTHSTTPVLVAPIAGSISAISAGSNHTLALTSTGRVWSWGANSFGQLGDGSTTTKTSPTLLDSAPFASLTIVAIAAGVSHSMALDSNGEVWVWGSNNFGQLGDGTTSTTPTPLPKKVLGLTGITRISAGDSFSIAVKSDSVPSGAVYAWGRNDAHQLGGNAALFSPPRTSPGQVLEGTSTALTGVVAIDAGEWQTLAVKLDGTTWTWGTLYFIDGALFPPVRKPVATLVPALSTARLLAAGGDILNNTAFNLVLQSDAIVMAWGSNYFGELGGGTPGDVLQWRPLPEPVPVLGEVVDVSAGGYHAVAVLAGGELFGWGRNSEGQLGDGGTTTRWAPVSVSGFRLRAGDSDPDHDGLTTDQEVVNGTDPFDSDSNDDGVLDGAAIASGISATNLDVDGDGATNATELSRGTSPFIADTDGDGSSDGIDCFPLDPSRSQCLPSNPNDQTPPTITLTEPTNAVPVP